MEDFRLVINVFSIHWTSIIRILVFAVSIAIFSAAVISCSSQETQVAPLKKSEMKEITVNGTRISYVEAGKGRPIVLVHGIPTSSFLWRKMIKSLSVHARVYALDLPGFGFSDPPPEANYSIAEYARLFEAFLDALSIKDADFVCHDLGGPIVLYYILHNPDKYHRLVILDTFLHTDIPVPLFYKIAKIRPFGEIFLWLAGKSSVRKAILDGVVKKSLISDSVIDRYYMPDGNPKKIKDAMLGTMRIDYLNDVGFIEKNLSTIEKPTIIIWGEKDPYCPISLGERIHNDIPRSRMVRLADCSHYIQEDCPEEATKIILEFLRK